MLIANCTQANNPLLTEEMFNKIEAMYEDHFQRGILKTRHPQAHQVFNGDEIGFDPTGRWGKVIRFAWDTANYTLGSAEKAPFWTTAWFWSRADGSICLSPTIIHQGAHGELGEYYCMQAELKDCNGDPSMQNTRFLPSTWIVHQVMTTNQYFCMCCWHSHTHTYSGVFCFAEPVGLQRSGVLLAHST